MVICLVVAVVGIVLVVMMVVGVGFDKGCGG